MSQQKGPSRSAVMFTSLQEAYDRLDAILESSYDGIYITDGQAVTIRVNRAYEAITGLSRDEIMGKSMWELERNGTIDRSGTLLTLASRKPETLEQTFRNGRRALISSTPIFNEMGDIVMVVTNVRDLTDLYELQDKFRDSEETAKRYRSEMEFQRKRVLAGADLVAVDISTLAMLEQADRVAALDAPVLLLGETGVGKEKVAKYIFKNSSRKTERFLTVNCGAIPENLMESEFFGYEKGAFTGANREGKLGIFEVADHGTLFLDEVGELPLNMQVKLLRALQEGQITRVGGTSPIKVDVRVVAATNRDLQRMVRDKTFREDLYYRLNVVPITIPPLRERRDDIIPFLETFLAELNKKYDKHKRFTPAAQQAMLAYDWPGNVRELRNVVERAVILTSGDSIYPEALPFYESRKPGELRAGADAPVDLKSLTAQFELRYLRIAYEKFGNVRDAAAWLGMDSSTFVRKRKRYEQAE